MVLVCNITFLKSMIHIIECMCYELLYTQYLLRLEEYFSVITCTFYIIDCLQGLGFLHCNFYILRLEINHFGPKSILLCTNRR